MAGIVRRTGILLLLFVTALLPGVAGADPPAPPVAVPAWVSAMLGGYDGEAANNDRHDPIHTEFSLGASGRPEGRYRVAEPTRTVEGTLTDFVALGPDRARFTWTDLYGTGPVDFTFDPAHGRFVGYWGSDLQADPALIWLGERPGLTSWRHGPALPSRDASSSVSMIMVSSHEPISKDG